MKKRKEERETDVDFVCVGCDKFFFLNIATRCSRAAANSAREQVFHSPECMTAWIERQPQNPRV